MSSDLKKLVEELERALSERGGSLDAPARDLFHAQIDGLKNAIEMADAAEIHRLRYDALNVFATLVSVITNVMTLLR